jgi:hypothetical protein
MSGVNYGSVTVATVWFQRATDTAISVGNPAVENGVTLASINESGLLTYRADLVSDIAIAAGVVVRGIRAQDESGQAIDLSLLPDRLKPLLMLRAADGGFASAAIGDEAIVNPLERLSCGYPGVAAVAFGPDALQLFNSKNGGARNWRIPHWGALVGGTPAHWDGNTVPATITAAIHQLAARVTALENP